MSEEPITMSMCVNTRDYFERRNEQLKRENKELMGRIATLDYLRMGAVEKWQTLYAENAELRKDKERLDWLDAQAYNRNDAQAQYWRWTVTNDHKTGVRKAIDAAMSDSRTADEPVTETGEWRTV